MLFVAFNTLIYCGIVVIGRIIYFHFIFMKNLLIGAFILVIIGAAGFFFLQTQKLHGQQAAVTTTNTKKIRIGLSMDTFKEDRWLSDRDQILKKAAELGATVTVFAANSDDATQVSQIENLISQKVDILIIVPHDSIAVAPTIDEAHKAGIKVISYDRLIKNSDVDLYVSFDNEKVGQLEAQGVLDVVKKGNFAYIGGSPTDNNSVLLKKGTMDVLDPLIKKGDIKLVYSQATPDWKPEEAYKNLKGFLSTGKTVDAVVAANDGTAFGVIQALQEKQLAGKVPVSGQDAELEALRRIVAGTQTITVYKPIHLLAATAVEAAVKIVNGEKIDTEHTVNNGKIEVPSLLLEPVIVNKDNIKDTVIKDNYHTEQEIYHK
jgi:D-xylose transport system substrate-binding protein